MVKCPNCNKELEDGARFCDECGTTIPEAPVVENVIFCPECGAKLPASAAFCDSCGAKLVNTGDAPAAQAGSAPTPGPELNTAPKAVAPAKDAGGKQGSGKKLALIGGIVAACVVLLAIIGVVGFVFLSGKGKGSSDKSNYALYIKEKEVFYRDLKGKTSSQVTDRMLDDKSLSNSDISSNRDAIARYIKLSDDGKYIFYPDKVSYKDSGVTLYYKKLSKLDKEGQKIDSGIEQYEVNKAMTHLTYVKNGDTLYSYSLKKADKEKIAGDVKGFDASEDGKKVYYVNTDGTLYLWTMGKDKEKVDSDVTKVIKVSENFDTIWYRKDDLLYRKTAGKDKEKISGNVTGVIAITESNDIYFLKDSEEEFGVDLFIYDDMKEEDENMEEPQYPNYYDYSNRDQYDKAVEKYNAKREKYYEKRNRDYYRENMEDYTPDIEVSELCYYNGKEVFSLDKQYVSCSDYTVSASALIYSSLNLEDIDKSPLSEVVSESMSFYSIIDEAVEKARTVNLALKDKVQALDSEDCRDFELDGDGERILFMKDYDYEKETGDLYLMNIKGGKLSDPELIESDVCRPAFVGDTYKYMVDVKDYTGELYIGKDQVSFDAYVYSGTNTDSGYYYYEDYSREKGMGTLYCFNKGKSVKIADDVSNYSLKGDKIVLLCNYSDSRYKGDLFLYEGKKLKPLDEDVVCLIYPYNYNGTLYSFYRRPADE